MNIRNILAKIIPWYYPFKISVSHLMTSPVDDPNKVTERLIGWAHEVGCDNYKLVYHNVVFKFSYPIFIKFKIEEDLLAAKLRFG